ncbi:tyrosine-protein phosphatase [Gemmata sp. JC717]|uniref:Tyrosine-protein phosphatase n=1 Tax=Gemmata algarum TaxID=2975278 RepID=A0ABU5F4M4_9BACT|nr:tyrosine-protein phosphatase [Gemmata algarum]MDY3553766.1 tyrosine-protein phosphatase [Gemmata algarum]MDY3562280.1 tyrosine-protein phosphatase [Gemmata algarum]
MRNGLRWVLGCVAAALVLGAPAAAYRAQYIHAKRFREVEPGRLYRSGQMTAAGFREAVDRYGIKTVVNLQHEEPDPLLPDHWLGKGQVRESELCAQLGVRYRLLTPDILPPGNQLDWEPPAVKQWRDLLDDESNYPVLLHCKAGLHRTGRLTAIYRMEYRGWSPGEALRELRANGYGYVAASEGDEFVIQFVQNYKPRSKAERLASGGAAGVAEGAVGGPRP